MVTSDVLFLGLLLFSPNIYLINSLQLNFRTLTFFFLVCNKGYALVLKKEKKKLEQYQNQKCGKTEWNT